MEDGQETSVFFRPLRHDVLLYSASQGEMGVNCCSEKERRLLLRCSGAVCSVGLILPRDLQVHAVAAVETGSGLPGVR